MSSIPRRPSFGLLLAALGIMIAAIGLTGTLAGAQPGNGKGPVPCAPGVDPSGEDGCTTPAGSQGKGCIHGKGLNKKGETGKAGHQGADCAPAVVNQPTTTTTAVIEEEEEEEVTTGTETLVDVSDDVTMPDEAEVAGEVVTREIPRAAPESLALTGPGGEWGSLVLLGLGLLMAGAGSRVALRGRVA